MAENMLGGPDFDDPDSSPTGPGNRAYSGGTGAYGAEPLPGITSGAAPKPWGLREPDRGAQSFGGGEPVSGFARSINRNRPADFNVDRGAAYPYPDVGTPRDELRSPMWKPYVTGGGMST